MLQWVTIKETDDEKTKARKKKLQKSFKSKQRFQEMDKQTQKKQQSWLDFKTGKGSKKKVISVHIANTCTSLTVLQARQRLRKSGCLLAFCLCTPVAELLSQTKCSRGNPCSWKCMHG